MNVIVHNKSRTVVKEAANVTEAIKLIVHLTAVFGERMYISKDKWALNYNV